MKKLFTLTLNNEATINDLIKLRKKEVISDYPYTLSDKSQEQVNELVVRLDLGESTDTEFKTAIDTIINREISRLASTRGNTKKADKPTMVKEETEETEQPLPLYISIAVLVLGAIGYLVITGKGAKLERMIDSQTTSHVEVKQTVPAKLSRVLRKAEQIEENILVVTYGEGRGLEHAKAEMMSGSGVSVREYDITVKAVRDYLTGVITDDELTAIYADLNNPDAVECLSDRYTVIGSMLNMKFPKMKFPPFPTILRTGIQTTTPNRVVEPKAVYRDDVNIDALKNVTLEDPRLEPYYNDLDTYGNAVVEFNNMTWEDLADVAADYYHHPFVDKSILINNMLKNELIRIKND